MAVDKKISQLTSLVQGDVDAALDVLPIVDTGADETKKITVTALVGAGASAGLSSVDINGGTIDGTTIGASSAAAGTFTTLGATTGNITTVNATTVDATNVEVTNVKAKDGTAAASIADSTGVVSITANPILSGGTANGVLYLNGSKVATSGSALTFDGTNLSNTGAAPSIRSTFTGGAYYTSLNADGVYASGTDLYLVAPASKFVSFYANNAEGMRLTSTGLGIGTTSPAARLDVVGASAGSTVATFTSNETGSTTSLAVFQRSGGAVAAAVKYNASNSPLTIDFGTTTNHGLTFLTNNTERMRLDSSGRLGIGTTPITDAKLDVAGSGTQRIYVRETGSDVKTKLLSSTTAGVISTETNHPLLFGTFDTTRMTLDSSGNLGLGVTPSAWTTASGRKAIEIGALGNAMFGNGASDFYMLSNAYRTASNFIYANNGPAAAYQHADAAHQWFSAASGTAGNAITFTQAMTLDSSGNLGLGGTPLTNSTFTTQTINGTNAILELARGGSRAARFYADGTGTTIGAYTSTPLIFITNDTERARITAGGFFKASNTGTYQSSTGTFHELRSDDADDGVVTVDATNASYTGPGFFVGAARDTTNNSFYAISYYNRGADAYKFRVADSGNVTNTNGSYGTISDAKMKTDIVDAGSQWNDIKAVRFRKFKMKDDPSGLTQLGVVAQELEQTSPGLVEEHADKDAEGNDLGTTTKSVKTSVLLMKAAVALQEAMARIEQLEAKVAALEA